MIIARDDELAILRNSLKDEYSQFIAVYGRRRVGKTFLVREAFNYKFTFQHAGLANGDKEEQLRNFANSLKDAGLKGVTTPDDWLDAFEMLKDLIRSSRAKKKIIFIDELSWMDVGKNNLLVALEAFWNGWASARKDIVLIVCASATSWIINNIVHNKGGLYNRLTSEIRVEPFTLGECEQYLKAKHIVMNRYMILECYMILGGVPFYWSLLKKGLSLSQNIDELFFSKKAQLKDEFEYLYASIFANPEQYISIITALGKKKVGMTREELLSATNIPSSGFFSHKLEELESCGFIRQYLQYGSKKKDKKYQLIDNFTLFYFKFLEKHPDDENYWTNQIQSSERKAWCGLAFERVCLEHFAQIKRALGISGVLAQPYTWQCKSDDDLGLNGSQIDLLIDRKDQVINLCEMKYSTQDYAITKAVDEDIRHKINDLQVATKTKSAIHITLVTTYGIKENIYSGNVQSVITADDLFA